MSATLAFDVYGTLIDTQGVVVNLEIMERQGEKFFPQLEGKAA